MLEGSGGCGVVEGAADDDDDGTPNCADGCPSDPDKTEPGVCDCGVADVNSDGDGALDCEEECHLDPDKTDAGICGCGTPDTDMDGDSELDCNDGCPNAPDKIAPGECGCGEVETGNMDGDSELDCNDGCPNDPDKIDPGLCGCGVPDGAGDSDGDGIPDCTENGDGDPWTDSGIFNGMRATQMNQCDTTPSCDEMNTVAEVDQCLADEVGTVAEVVDMHSGWDWEVPPGTNDICSTEYDFQPGWSVCGDVSWQVHWTGTIDLSEGNHCFAVEGGRSRACTTFIFQGSVLTPGDAAVCMDMSAGQYPIRWFHIMDDTSLRVDPEMRILYCAGGLSTCVPTDALPNSRLRPSD
ncbi:MAG: hypothetical protein OXT09_17720 [Myxococcales bacterium]|nr:hypothetical protein [Myxococcales bacterium]